MPQQQCPYQGMKDETVLVKSTHEGETAIGLPPLLHIHIIKGRQEHVEDSRIEKAGERAHHQFFLFRFRPLA